jgi:hypothetical protein
MMRFQSRDYDYVEIPRAPLPPPDVARADRYRKMRAALHREITVSLGNIASAKRAYDARTGRSPQSLARENRRRLCSTLRLENAIRQQMAFKNAPARMVANMLDNWPAWYPKHLKPSPDVAAEDIKRREKKPSRRRLRSFR